MINCECATYAITDTQVQVNYHHPNCSKYSRKEEQQLLAELVKSLLWGIEHWSQLENEIPIDVWPTYVAAKEALGLPINGSTDPNPPLCEVLSVNADKRSIDIRLRVKGDEYEINHDHWNEYNDDEKTTIKPIGHTKESSILSSEYCKYRFDATVKIDDVQIKLERTYDKGFFITVDNGERQQTAAYIDHEEWVCVDGKIVKVYQE